jgi:UDP-glucose 4-epimerase
MSTVMITGAGGFVGRHVTQVMLRHGLRVIAVDQAFDPDLAAAWEGQPVDVIALNPGDPLPDTAADYVVHGAAITADPRENGDTPEANFRANIDPLLDTLTWAAARSVKRTLFISSSAVYRTTPPGLIAEDTPATPLGLYAVAKTAGEQLIDTLRGEFGRDVLAIRLSNVYGSGEHARATRPRLSLVGRYLTEALRAGSVTVTDPEIAREWTLTTDIGEAVYALLHAPRLNHALYHVASGHLLTSREVADVIARALPGTVVNLRPESAAALTRLGTLAHTRLTQDTGFDSWTPFDTGIRQVIADMRSAASARVS